jgi:hypothetical protein
MASGVNAYLSEESLGAPGGTTKLDAKPALGHWPNTTFAAGWRSNGVVFWSSDDMRLETRCLPGRLLEYAFTGDHHVQGELCSVVKF